MEDKKQEKSIEEAIEGVREYTARRTAEAQKKPGVYIKTFGCQQNEADSERLCGIAEAMGYVNVGAPEEAELIIFNTCAVREHAELKALSLTGQLKHIKAQNPELIICVCGCMTAQDHRMGDLKNKYPYVDLIFGATSPQKFPEYLLNTIRRREDAHESRKRLFFPDSDALITEGLPVRRESSYKAWVSIMYGCNNFCTYCVVPYVRGRERSRRHEDILAEVSELASEGYKEITLLGQNVNSYGKDLYNGEYDFADLLGDICRLEGDFWIRFMTSHPKDASDRLIDVIAENSGEGKTGPRIARHFHLPLQAGSDKVLREMNRRYTSDYYLSLVKKLKEKVPGIGITSDIIVGFPGETEEDFEDTLKVLEEAGFDNIYSFIYSPRKGTPAAEREQLPKEVKSERFARLLEVQNSISLEKNRAYIGKTVRVLVEGISKNDPSALTGRSELNRLVHFKGDEKLTGRFADVIITDADIYTLSGELAEKNETNGSGDCAW